MANTKSEEKQQTESYQVLRRLYLVQGERDYHLACFGNHLAEKHGYKEHKDMDAVRFYLIEKYHWLPSQVKSLSFEDMGFLLEEEMSGWTIPAAARKTKNPAD